jgi:hypothetical protein
MNNEMNKCRNTIYQSLTQKEKSLIAKIGKCGEKGKYLQSQDVVIKCLTSVLLLFTHCLVRSAFLVLH